MPGNSSRRGAQRKPGTKKGAVVGSGGQRRKQLKGKGPTPKAADRPGHKASRRQAAAAKASGAARPGRQRRAGGEVIVGRNAVVEAMRAGVPANRLVVQTTADLDERLAESLHLAGRRGIEVVERPRPDLDELSRGEVHQGVVLEVPAFAYADLDTVLSSAGPAPLVVLLDSITDPHNVGAIARSAAAFGADALVLPTRRSARVNAATWRTSSGALARLPVAQVTNLTRTIDDLKESGFFVYGLAADADRDLTALTPRDADGPVALVIGSEGEGLGRLVGEHCDELLGIHMAPGNESLNASVAAAIAMHAISALRRA